MSGLQNELRQLFLQSSSQRAIQDALALLAKNFGASYVVVHARLGAQFLSEEWSKPELTIDECLREMTTNVMLEAMAASNAKCTRVRLEQTESAIVAGILSDDDGEQAGAIAMLLHGCGRDRAIEVLSQFEGVVGFTSVLLSRGTNEATVETTTSRDLGAVDTAQHPLRLAFGMAADLKNRHGYEITSIGFVRNKTVKVVAVSGLDEIRASNPGVRKIRAAMEECLDRRDVVLHQGQVDHDSAIEDDSHLHRQWSIDLGGDSVASVPLFSGQEIVAIVSVTRAIPEVLTRPQVEAVREEMAAFGRLVPLSSAANRSLARHCVESVSETCGQALGKGRRRFAILTTLFVLAFCWLVFGKITFSFTVPSSVAPQNQRVVSAPRDGVLAEFFVKPGDTVTKGQLLAVLDDHDDVLKLAELKSQLAAMEAKADRALADRDSGAHLVHEAEIDSVRAQISIVQASLERARVRAPHEGVVLEGDLEERLGARVSLGEQLFTVASLDRMRIFMQIPDTLVRDARDSRGATFSPAARPEEKYELSDLQVAPASTVADGKNVFLTRASTSRRLAGLSPGMEGVVYVDAGRRPVWWVLTRRITNWLRLNFWV